MVCLKSKLLAWQALIQYLGGNVRYDRGSGACTGQTEGGDSDAVFLLQAGATLQ